MASNNQISSIAWILALFISLSASINLLFGQSLELISAELLKKHVFVLGSDSMRGRGTGQIGEKLAAEYISQQLKIYGLIPPGEQKSYFQNIPKHSSTPLANSELKFFSESGDFVFQLERDYLLYKTGAQTFIPQPAPLAFVGYGIIAPEFDYNDYQALNVEGKIVVFLSGEPSSDDTSYFAGADPTIYSYPEAKQRLAISRGARGSILIPSLRDEQGRNWQHWIHSFAFEDVTLAYSVSANLSIVMNPNAATRLFYGSAVDLNEIFALEKQGAIHSFDLAGKISFHGNFVERDFLSSNVLGLLPGKTLAPNDSYLIISAHYDHLGIGRAVAGDSIYNGVFDNAVGVAALLEIARIFVHEKSPPLHSVLFFFSTGEEKGLLGTTYYTDHPIVPLYKTMANVNIDGLSMFDRFKDIVGVGAELSTLGNELKVVAKEMNLKVSPLPSCFIASESFARSDQIAFAKVGIPAILIAEGLEHENLTREQALLKMLNWMDKIYHSPFDDLTQPMNFEAAWQHCQFIYKFCHHLANLPTFPEWKSGTCYINARLQTIAEKR